MLMQEVESAGDVKGQGTPPAVPLQRLLSRGAQGRPKVSALLQRTTKSSFDPQHRTLVPSMTMQEPKIPAYGQAYGWCKQCREERK